VVRHEVAHPLEPERRELRQHFALVGNAGAEDVVEGGDAIGGDEEQVVSDLIDVADLAAPVEFQIGEGRFENWWHGEVRIVTPNDAELRARNCRLFARALCHC
jgi:hypothetical protein